MNKELIKSINNNEVIGHTTDTVFGLVAKLNRENISKINELKERDSDQPLQILISNLNQLKDIVEETEYVKNYLESKLKPKTSYIVKVKDNFNDEYLLDSFNKTIMFRLVEGDLKNIIEKVGPLFASSANKHDQEVFLNYEAVEDTFDVISNRQDQLEGKASTIISLVNDKEKVLRE